MRWGAGMGGAVAIALALGGGAIQAQTTYTWTQTAGGTQNWDTAENWSGGAIPDPAAGDTVDFGAVNLAANATLVLGADRTAEVWKFGDTSGAQTWTVSAGNRIVLAGTTPTIHVAQNSATLNNVLDGVAGLAKTGAGTLTLSGNNTYGGDTTIQAGTVNAAHVTAFGTGTNVTVAGSATIAPGYGLYPVLAQGLTVNSGATATISLPTQYYRMTFTGPLAGGGILYALGSPGGAGGALSLTNANNTFTGTIQNYSPGNGSLVLTVNSLPDSTNRIRLNGGAYPGLLALGAGLAKPLLFESRQIELYGSGGGCIQNNNAAAANTISIRTDLLVSTNGNKKFTLGGSNTGTNTFAGAITNGPGTNAVISLAKADAGRWILSGTNTYSGATTISGGTLEIGGAGVLGGGIYAGNVTNNATLRWNSSADQTLSGAIVGTGVLIKENDGTLTLAGTNSYSGATTIRSGALVGVTGGGCVNSAVTVTNAPDSVAALGIRVTDGALQWSCASLAFRTNGVGAQLRFQFDVEPSGTLAPLSVTGNLTFSGAPEVVVQGVALPGGLYPLVVVGGAAPAEVPTLNAQGAGGALFWGGPDNKTLYVTAGKTLFRIANDIDDRWR